MSRGPSPTHQGGSPDSPLFAALGAALFLGVVALVMARHEMWRDETTAWLLTRESGSLAELVHNLRYEGHPLLWYLLLWIPSRLTASVAAMQAVAAAVATVTAFVVLRWGPWSRVVRVLLLFGYFFAFEYTVVARGYVVAPLCVALFGALLSRRHTNLLGIALVLGLLAQTSAYGVFTAGALGLGLLIDRALARERFLTPRALGAVVVAAAAVFLSIRQMLPPPDEGSAGPRPASSSVSEAWEVASTVGGTWEVLVPIGASDGGVAHWGQNLIPSETAAQVGGKALAGILVLGAFALTLARRPAAMATLVSGTAVVLAFALMGYPDGPRHLGHLVLMLVGAVWLARAGTPAWEPRGRLGRWVRLAEEAREPLFVAFVVIQFAAGVQYLVSDLRFPFSTAKATAAALEDLDPDAELPLAVASATHGSSLSAYLARPVWRLDGGNAGTWVDLRLRRTDLDDPEDLGASMTAFAPDGGPILVVSHEPLPDRAGPWSLATLRTPDPAMVAHERFVVYRAQASRTDRSAGSPPPADRTSNRE